MDNKCLTVEDMLDLLTAERIQDDNQERLFNINMHLMLCDSCGEGYRKLVKLYDIIEGWSVAAVYETEQKLQHSKVCLSLLYAQKAASPTLVSRIDKWLKNYVDSSARIFVTVSDAIKLAVDDACSFVRDDVQMEFDFASAGARSINLGETTKIDYNFLIDEKNPSNRIKIVDHRTIRVSLADIFGVAPLVALVPRDAALSAVIAELVYDEKLKCWVAEIENLCEGEYDLVIEAQAGE